MTTYEFAGSYRLVEDDETGARYWEGASPGDKDTSRMDDGEPITLDPMHWAIGTVIEAKEPQSHTWDCPCAECEQTRAAGLEYVGDYDEEE